MGVFGMPLQLLRGKQVLTFVSHRGYLNNTQHGFRVGRSCLSALLDVYDNIMHMINNKSTVYMIYRDFSKVFDKVDHGILLHKLRFGHYRQARTMVLPFPKQQAALCKNTWWHQPTSSCSEWSAPR